jgi:hypothetical protein
MKNEILARKLKGQDLQNPSGNYGGGPVLGGVEKNQYLQSEKSRRKMSKDAHRKEQVMLLKQEEREKWDELQEERFRLKIELENQRALEKMEVKKRENEKLKALLDEQKKLRTELGKIGNGNPAHDTNLLELARQKKEAVRNGMKIEDEIRRQKQQQEQKEDIIAREHQKAREREAEIQKTLQRQKELEKQRKHERQLEKERIYQIEESRLREFARLQNIEYEREQERAKNHEKETKLTFEKKLYEQTKDHMGAELQRHTLKKKMLEDQYEKEKQSTLKKQMEYALQRER